MLVFLKARSLASLAHLLQLQLLLLLVGGLLVLLLLVLLLLLLLVVVAAIMLVRRVGGVATSPASPNHIASRLL